GASRLIVLDIDPRHDGDESLAELEHRFGALPDVPTVHTGGGGTHCYFEYPIAAFADPMGVRCRVKLGGFPGVDLKADGGYVVAPPSIHPDTGARYVWDLHFDLDSTPRTPVPAWILELAATGPADHGRVRYE